MFNSLFESILLQNFQILEYFYVFSFQNKFHIMQTIYWYPVLLLVKYLTNNILKICASSVLQYWEKTSILSKQD